MPVTERQMSRREVMRIMIGLMISVLLSGLDSTIVGTAMPRIVGDLQGMDLYAWPFVAYMLCSTIAIILFGKISDIHGRKPIFLAGIITFLVGSMLCGLSQNMVQLVLLRGLQGVGGGILISIAFTILADLFPPRERGKYAGLLTSMWGVASIVGPAVGGFITDHLNWRWVFYVNIPVGLVAIVTTVVRSPISKARPQRKPLTIKERQLSPPRWFRSFWVSPGPGQSIRGPPFRPRACFSFPWGCFCCFILSRRGWPSR